MKMAGFKNALSVGILLILSSYAAGSDQICTDEVDIFIMVDASGSISFSDYSQLKIKIADLVGLPFDNLNVNYAFMQFSTFVNGILSFQDQLDPALVAQYFLFYEGQQTYLDRALTASAPYFTVSRGARANSHKYMVLFTDGQPTLYDEAVEEAKKLKDSGIEIIGVGVGNSVNMAGVQELASHNMAFDSSNLASMDTISGAIVNKVVGHADAICKRCPGKVDVVIVLDGSNSVTSDDFNLVAGELANFVGVDTFGGVNAQYSFVQIGTFAQSISHFNYMVEPAFVANHFLSREGQQTKIKLALELVPEHFEVHRGARPDAAKVVILYTDGDNSDTDGGFPAADAAAKALKDDGIFLFTVGISNANETALSSYASEGLDYDGTDLSKLAEVHAAMNTKFAEIIQELCDEAPCETPTKADVLIIVDASGSIPYSMFQKIKTKTAEYVGGRGIGGLDTQYAFMTFSTFPVQYPMFKDDVAPDFVASVFLQYGGQQSYTEKALENVPAYFTEANGHRLDALKLVILISDGGAVDPAVALVNANALKNGGYQIFGLCLGPDASLPDLSNLAEAGALSVSDVDQDLVKGFEHISTTVQTAVDETCEDKCPDGVDIVFVVDASTTITSASFNALKTYGLGTIDSLDATGLDLQYSFIAYSSLPTTTYSFQEFIDQPFFSPKWAMTFMQYGGQQSKLSKGLEKAQLHLTTDYGAREKSMKVVLLFSDCHFTEPDSGQPTATEVISTLESEGVLVVVFGYGSDVNTAYLTTRSQTAELVFDASDISTMPAHSQALADFILNKVNGLCGLVEE